MQGFAKKNVFLVINKNVYLSHFLVLKCFTIGLNFKILCHCLPAKGK